MLTIGELCAGYSGLAMGVQMVMDAKVAWVSEISPGASMVLAHRLPDVPNVGDLRTAPWGAIRPVDILCAGFPSRREQLIALGNGVCPQQCALALELLLAREVCGLV